MFASQKKTDFVLLRKYMMSKLLCIVTLTVLSNNVSVKLSLIFNFKWYECKENANVLFLSAYSLKKRSVFAEIRSHTSS